MAIIDIISNIVRQFGFGRYIVIDWYGVVRDAFIGEIILGDDVSVNFNNGSGVVYMLCIDI